MFGPVQTFGKDNPADFAPGSKATAHFTTIAQVIKDLDAAKASQQGGGVTAKAVLLEALRLGIQNIGRTAEVAEGNREAGRWPSSTSTASIKAGMKEVNYLDAIIRNKYARNADKLRAWESASHIERAPQREKKPATTSLKAS